MGCGAPAVRAQARGSAGSSPRFRRTYTGGVDSTPAVDPAVTGGDASAARLTLYTSAFCEPCMQTRAVLAEAARLAPRIAVTELDVARNLERAERDGIRSTPTVIVAGQDGAEVFRAEGVPTLAQVLAAAAKAL